MQSIPPLSVSESRDDTVGVFRRRLDSVLARAGTSPAAFARRAGIDRSTLSQLMTDAAPRLPRAETLMALAKAAHVSVDWLLGLSQREEVGAEIIEAMLQIETPDHLPADDHFMRWLNEAEGYRIRTVPLALPDFLKTEAVLRLEYAGAFAAAAPARLDAVRARLDFMRKPEHDVEVCVALQSLWGLAAGQDLWLGLGPAERRAQLVAMADIYRDAYPSLRLYLYDLRDVYASPFTVFGPKRAVLFLGQAYLVLNGADHIRMFARRFDDIIRRATVQPHDVERTIRALAETAEGGTGPARV